MNKIDKEQRAQKKEGLRRKKDAIKSLENEVRVINKTAKGFEKTLKTQQRSHSYYEELVKDNPFSNMSLEEVAIKHAEMEELVNKTHAGSNSIWKDIYDTKQEIKRIHAEIKKLNSENKKKFKQMLKDIEKRFGKNGLKSPDALPKFEKNDEWQESDEVQQEFDKQASDGDELVHNGLRKIGSGKRNVLMTIDKLENALEEIDLSKIFKEKLGLDELKNYNDFISEIRDVGDKKDSTVALTDKQYFPATTQFDIVRSELRPNNMDSVIAIRNKNANTINELAAIFKVKMRNVKHIKFKGNQEEGLIDVRSVYKIPNNIDDHIFERAFVKPNDRVAVTVALDISGSMDKDYTDGGKKLKEIAVIIDAALSKAMIRHEVVGYGAPADGQVAALEADEKLYTRTQHRLETVVYRSFEGANGLGNVEVKCWDNADAESLRNIAARLMKTRSKMKVIINIGDGKPFLHGADAGILDNDLKKTLSWLGVNKIKMYSLGFNDYPKNTYGKEYMRIDNYNQLPRFFRDSK